jgi:hypothetical protein
MKRPEYGSDFHFVDLKEEAAASIGNIYPDHQLHFSGRSALFNLVEWGTKKYGWKKLFLPHYYCHEVTQFLGRLPVAISFYDDGPYNLVEQEMSEIDKAGNVCVKVNYFGFTNTPSFLPARAILIEDHTHDLISNWAQTSMAHYCFASLRKSLPVPTGGIVWSPGGMMLPDNANAENNSTAAATYMKLCAMLMKKIYLDGGNVNKQDYRKLFVDSEQLFETVEARAALSSFTAALIKKVDAKQLRTTKQHNYNWLLNSLQDKNPVWMPGEHQGKCPFGMMFYFDAQDQRDAFKTHLIEQKIYPAVLWPRQRDPKAAEFSGRTLLVHCDFRYTPDDMMFIADVINQYNNENKNYFSLGQARME